VTEKKQCCANPYILVIRNEDEGACSVCVVCVDWFVMICDSRDEREVMMNKRGRLLFDWCLCVGKSHVLRDIYSLEIGHASVWGYFCTFAVEEQESAAIMLNFVRRQNDIG
jgi:hypothetical protein